jgi:phosphoribosyl 1,2-cyclic phosphate phosphodiesterase
LFTHGHADHVFGLDDVRVFPYYLKRPLPVYCEADVEDRIRRSFDYAFEPGAERYAGGVPQLEMRRIGTEPFEILGATVTPVRLGHGRFRVLGFRIGNVAYCTDTNHIPEEGMSQLRGLDVLILDALRPRPHPTHFSLDQAIEAACQLGARRTYFTHISHELEHAATNARLPPGMEMAYDGLRIPLT